jgi:type II secretory pathway pseudopilin PulG
MGDLSVGSEKLMNFYKISPTTRAAFSFVEAMLAMLILGLLAAGVFMMISESNRGTTSAYQQYLAEQLAREPLEVFRFLGGRKVLNNQSQELAGYKFNEWQKIVESSETGGIKRPEDATKFERRITLTPLNKDGTEGVLIQVDVRSAAEGNPLGLETGQQLSRSAILVAQP